MEERKERLIVRVLPQLYSYPRPQSFILSYGLPELVKPMLLILAHRVLPIFPSRLRPILKTRFFISASHINMNSGSELLLDISVLTKKVVGNAMNIIIEITDNSSDKAF